MIFNGKIHYKSPFSVAFCMFTRGYPHETTIFWPTHKRLRRRRVLFDAQVSVSKTRQNVRFEVWSVRDPGSMPKKSVVLESEKRTWAGMFMMFMVGE